MQYIDSIHSAGNFDKTGGEKSNTCGYEPWLTIYHHAIKRIMLYNIWKWNHLKCDAFPFWMQRMMHASCYLTLLHKSKTINHTPHKLGQHRYWHSDGTNNSGHDSWRWNATEPRPSNNRKPVTGGGLPITSSQLMRVTLYTGPHRVTENLGPWYIYRMVSSGNIYFRSEMLVDVPCKKKVFDGIHWIAILLFRHALGNIKDLQAQLLSNRIT